MKRNLLILAACALMATVVSCEYDSPDIKFQQTTTVTNDYSEVVKALQDQTMSLTEKMGLIEEALKNQTFTLSQKMGLIEEAIKNQTFTLSQKMGLIEEAVNSGLVGEDSTLALVKKAIEALNATAGTANDKLDAIKEAINSPTSGLNVKLDAIREAVAQGLANLTEKQELILKALNSSSTHTFTKDELLEVGDDYLLVDNAFWDANHENYEVVRTLKDLIPLSLPHKYKFYYQQSSGKYPVSDSENTSFYGPLYTEGGILNDIKFNEEGVILAVYIDAKSVNPDPVFSSLNGHTCYYIKKVNKNCTYQFWVKIGDRAAGKNLKVKDMNASDTFSKIGSPDGDYIEYNHASKAIKATTGVWGFRGLRYLPNDPSDNSVEFIIVEDN